MYDGRFGAAGPRSASEASREAVDRARSSIEPSDGELRAWFERYADQHSERLAIDLDLLDAYVRRCARILEYGATPLLLTAALAQTDADLSAVDLAPERFADTIETLGLDVRKCDVETEHVPFEDGTFDVVLFNELFEHLRIDPIFTMREVARVLKPDGTLMLSTPNLRSFRGVRNLISKNLGHSSSGGIYEQYDKLEKLGHMGHVREYTCREVAEFLRHFGLTPVKVVFRGGHGRGLVGLAERLAPGFRPFFTVIARKAAA